MLEQVLNKEEINCKFSEKLDEIREKIGEILERDRAGLGNAFEPLKTYWESESQAYMNRAKKDLVVGKTSFLGLWPKTIPSREVLDILRTTDNILHLVKEVNEFLSDSEKINKFLKTIALGEDFNAAEILVKALNIEGVSLESLKEARKYMMEDLEKDLDLMVSNALINAIKNPYFIDDLVTGITEEVEKNKKK